MKRRRFLLIFAALLSTAALLQAQIVPESADAFHYRDWAGSGHDGTYTEWWYFNVYDPARNVKAIFTYFVTNPANLLGQGLLGFGLAQMTAVAYQPNNIVTENDIYPLAQFSASYDRANVTIGSNTLAALDEDTYQITGATRDGRISWDLLYHRDAGSWFAADHFNVAPEPWQQMSWLLYMPRALVSGTLIVDGQTYAINAPGYHDHNWGEWELNLVPFNWAQYSQPGFTLDLGDFPLKGSGRASIEVKGTRYIFEHGQYNLIHTQWAYDFKNFAFYATASLLFANNGNAQVAVSISTQQTDPLSEGLPWPIPNLVIYEQPARFTGQVWLKDAIGVWRAGPSFDGNGFREYTAIAP